MLYGRSIKFYKPLNPHYYGSKEEGKESSKEDCSKEEEEGISHISSTKKNSCVSRNFSLWKNKTSELLRCGAPATQSPYSEYASFAAIPAP
jgi:hypothetical protein